MAINMNERGFSAIDMLLAIVLLAAVGGACYIALQNTHKNISSATVSPLPRQTPSPTPASVEQGGVLTIAQFSVSLTVPNSLRGLSYVYSPAIEIRTGANGQPNKQSARVNLISAQLKGQQTICQGYPGNAFDGNIGSISQTATAPTNMDGSQMALPKPQVKKIGGWYYMLGLPNGGRCFTGALGVTEASQRTLITQAFLTLK